MKIDCSHFIILNVDFVCLPSQIYQSHLQFDIFCTVVNITTSLNYMTFD